MNWNGFGRSHEYYVRIAAIAAEILNRASPEYKFKANVRHCIFHLAYIVFQ
jgi:hypothetical protein